MRPCVEIKNKKANRDRNKDKDGSDTTQEQLQDVGGFSINNLVNTSNITIDNLTQKNIMNATNRGQEDSVSYPNSKIVSTPRVIRKL